MMETVYLNNLSERSHPTTCNLTGPSLSYTIGILYYDGLKVISNKIKSALCFVLDAIKFF